MLFLFFSFFTDRLVEWIVGTVGPPPAPPFSSVDSPSASTTLFVEEGAKGEEEGEKKGHPMKLISPH